MFIIQKFTKNPPNKRKLRNKRFLTKEGETLKDMDPNNPLTRVKRMP